MVVNHSASAISRRGFLDVGGYDERFVRAQDFDLFLRLRTTARFATSEEVFLHYRYPLLTPFSRFQENWRFHRLAVGSAGLPVENSPGLNRAGWVSWQAKKWWREEIRVRDAGRP